MFRDLFSLSGSPVVAAITAMLGATGAALPTPAVAQNAAPLAVTSDQVVPARA